MQQALDHRIEGVARHAAYHERSGRGGEAAAERGAGSGILDVGLAVKRIFDRAIAGAAAEVSLERSAEVLPLCLVERCAGHDHARGAEPALKGLGVEERLLHRVDAAAASEAFDGGHGMPVGAKGRDQAAMHRLAVDQHRTGAAITGVAAFLDAEMPELAQEGSQALPGPRSFGKRLAVDLEAHDHPAPASSARISSARRKVMCLRHKGLPWMSS